MSGSPRPEESPPRAAAGDAVRAEIEAEIADHLAASAGELARQGTDPAQAAVAAAARFGDVEAVKRRCFWVQRGDQIMTRAAAITLMALAASALGVVLFGAWGMQRSFNSRMDQLTGQLSALTRTQEDILKRAEQERPRPLEITGRLYLGDPETPAAGAAVSIRRFIAKGSEAVRNVRSDDEGQFTSGPLPPGDYCVTTWLVPGPDAAPGRDTLMVQSEPLYLYDNAANRSVSMNILGRRPRWEWDLVWSPPDGVAADESAYHIIVEWVVQSDVVQELWYHENVPPKSWPLLVGHNRIGQTQTSLRNLAEESNPSGLVPGNYAVQLLFYAYDKERVSNEQSAERVSQTRVLHFGETAFSSSLALNESIVARVVIPPELTQLVEETLEAGPPDDERSREFTEAAKSFKIDVEIERSAITD